MSSRGRTREFEGCSAKPEESEVSLEQGGRQPVFSNI